MMPNIISKRSKKTKEAKVANISNVAKVATVAKVEKVSKVSDVAKLEADAKVAALELVVSSASTSVSITTTGKTITLS